MSMSWQALATVVTTIQLKPSVLALFPAVADGRMNTLFQTQSSIFERNALHCLGVNVCVIFWRNVELQNLGWTSVDRRHCSSLLLPASSVTTLSTCFTNRVWRDVVSVCMLLKFSKTVGAKDQGTSGHCSQWARVEKEKCLQHLVFPSRLPSKY